MTVNYKRYYVNYWCHRKSHTQVSSLEPVNDDFFFHFYYIIIIIDCDFAFLLLSLFSLALPCICGTKVEKKESDLWFRIKTSKIMRTNVLFSNLFSIIFYFCYELRADMQCDTIYGVNLWKCQNKIYCYPLFCVSDIGYSKVTVVWYYYSINIRSFFFYCQLTSFNS